MNKFKLPLQPSSHHEVFFRAPDLRFALKGPSGGKATEVVVLQGGAELPGPRVD